MNSNSPVANLPSAFRHAFRLGFCAGGDAALQALLEGSQFDVDAAAERAWDASFAKELADTFTPVGTVV